EALPRLVRAVVALHEERARLHRTLFAESPLDPELMGMLRAARDEACARVARWLAARPEVTVEDPALAARLLFEALVALAHGFALDPTAGADLAARERALVRMLAAWLVSPAPAASR